jgi:hypothetical protein
MSYKNMRKSLIFVSLGCGLLMTAAGAQAPSNAQPQKGAKAEEKAEKKAEEKAEKKAEKAEMSSTPAPTSSSACYLWKGRGGAPAGYMATHASCRPWGSNQGWGFLKNNNGVSYYQGTLKDAGATPSTWAVYADFSSAVFSSKAEYDWFVANTRLSGSCAECLR